MSDPNKNKDKKYESFEEVFSKACLVLNQAITSAGKPLIPNAPLPEIMEALKRLEKDVQTFVNLNKANVALIQRAKEELPELKKEDLRMLDKAQKLIEQAHQIKKEMKDEQDALRLLGQEEKLKLEQSGKEQSSEKSKESSEIQQRKAKFRKSGGTKWKPV